MKRFLTLSVLWVATLTTLCSCGETKQTDEHSNWEERNADFIDGKAQECAGFISQGVNVDNAVKRQMFRLLSYSLDSDKEWGNSSYVYCEVIQKGTGTVSPLFTDSVRVNYRLRLIPTDTYPNGQVVDQSFKTNSLDPTLNIPASLQVSTCVKGISSALIHMHCGDFWRVYVPQELGYGANPKSNSSIPAYSALVFDINLVEFARTGDDLPPL